MANFRNLGSGLARGIERNASNRQNRELKKEEDRKAQEEKIRIAVEESRTQSLQMATTFGELGVEAKGKGATEEQMGQFRSGAQSSLMKHASVLAEFHEKDPNLFSDPTIFVNEHMELYDAAIANAAIEDTSDDFETVSTEELAELERVSGFKAPEGALVQRGPDNKIVLSFDPTENPSVLKERRDLLLASGLDQPMGELSPEEIANGIAGGRFRFGVNPITKEMLLEDLSGQEIAREPLPEPVETPPVVAPGVDPKEAVGGAGFLKNAANILTDAIGQGIAFEETQEATSALNVIQQQTKLLMQSVVPGRPAKDIRDGLKLLTLTPNSFFQGPVRAKSTLEATQRWLDNEIVRIENMLDTPLSPTDRSTLLSNIGPLQEMSRSHQDLIDAFGSEEEETDPAIKAALDEFAPEDDESEPE